LVVAAVAEVARRLVYALCSHFDYPSRGLDDHPLYVWRLRRYALVSLETNHLEMQPCSLVALDGQREAHCVSLEAPWAKRGLVRVEHLLLKKLAHSVVDSARLL
jgi:hypothetical protein